MRPTRGVNRVAHLYTKGKCKNSTNVDDFSKKKTRQRSPKELKRPFRAISLKFLPITADSIQVNHDDNTHSRHNARRRSGRTWDATKYTTFK